MVAKKCDLIRTEGETGENQEHKGVKTRILLTSKTNLTHLPLYLI